MADENIQVIQVNGAVLIGNLQGNLLRTPRAIAIYPAENKVFVKELFGQPEEITLHNMVFSYEADPNLVKIYREAVTGLTLTNQMPKEK